MLRERHKQNYNIKDEQTARLYGIWHNMNQRCYNTRNMLYPRYGERGIEVCDLWRNTNPYGFACFVSWAWQNGYNDTLTIDRINNSRGYDPLNCRWATQKEQCRNRRSNTPVIVNGVQFGTLIEACEAYGRTENYQAIRDRIEKCGWIPQEAFDKPIAEKGQSNNHPVTVNGTQYKSIAEACRLLGLNCNAVKNHKCKYHTTAEEAIYHYIKETRT